MEERPHSRSTRSTSTGTPIRGSLGKGLKEPTFFEAFATGFAVGNPDLEPERSRTVEFGVERSFADERVRLRGTVFRQDLENLIQYTFSPPAPGDPKLADAVYKRRGWTNDGVPKLETLEARLPELDGRRDSACATP